MDPPWLDGVQRPRTPKRIPWVLTVAEMAALLSALPTDMALLARLLYGTGMRLMEGLYLRVKDVDFDSGVVVVRQAKGDKDRVVVQPRSLAAELRRQMLAARAVGARPAGAARWRGRSACIGEQIPRRWAALGTVRSPLHPCRWTRAQVCGIAITPMRSDYSAHCRRPWHRRAFAHPFRCTRYVTASPRTCCSRAPMFGRCRSCWGTRT